MSDVTDIYIGIDPGATGYITELAYRDQSSFIGFGQWRLPRDLDDYIEWLKKYGKRGVNLTVVQEAAEKFIGNQNMKSSHGVAYGHSAGRLEGIHEALAGYIDFRYEIVRAKDWMGHFGMKKGRANRRTGQAAESTGAWKKRLRQKAWDIMGAELITPVAGADSLLLAIYAKQTHEGFLC